MKNVLILFSKKSQELGLADPSKLSQLLNQTDRGVQAESAFFEDITYYTCPEKVEFVIQTNGKKIEDYDVVYFRHWGLPESQSHALAIARYCSLKRIPFIDKEVLRIGSLNKITQYINLYEAGVPFPITFIAEANHIVAGAKKYGFSYPCILKASRASRGQDNFLISSQHDLEKTLNDHPSTSFVLQEYIQNDGDYRILVFGDEIGLIIQRQATHGSHLNNTSQGGTAGIVQVNDVPEHVRQDSIIAAKFMGRDFAGVDMVIDNTSGKHYCFEVNRAPQLENSSFEGKKAILLANFLARL